MSAQAKRRNASPRSGPQPIRATLPFTLRQGSPTRSSNGRRSSPGPASSPTQPWPSSSDSQYKSKHRQSSDHRTSPERSPSSPGFRVEKPKAVRASPAPQIRRTSSLDTIAGPYLTGHWPRSESTFTSYNGLYGPNQKHQGTQTDDIERKGSHKRSSSWGSADNLKEKIKQQLRKQGSRQSSSTTQRASPVHANHSTVANLPSPVTAIQSSSSSSTTTTTSTSTSSSSNSSSTSSSQTSIPTTPSSSMPSFAAQVSVSTSLIGQAHTLPRSTAIPVPNTLRAPPFPRIRGSVEGLNQEVEKLVLSGNEEEERPQADPLPDGHRAPVPGVANMQTQTPAENQDDSSDQGSRNHSVSPTFVMDNSRPSSRSSSTGNGDTKVEKGDGSPEYHFGTKYSSSPSHNKSWQLTRDPPDGCEKPQKTREETSGLTIHEEFSSLAYCPDSKLSFKLKPSDSSAFCTILPNFPPGEFTMATLTTSTQTQTGPHGNQVQAQTQTAEVNGVETNGHLE